MNNPIELPEIRAIIGSFLTRDDLIICAQVCRSWRSSFQPLIWRDAIIGAPIPSLLRPPLPSPEHIRAHAHLIRTLSIQGLLTRDQAWLLDINYDQLRHIRICAIIDANVNQYHVWEGLAAIIRSNRETLESMSLGSTLASIPEQTDQMFWEAVRDCFPHSLSSPAQTATATTSSLSPSFSTRLQSLILYSGTIQEEDLLNVWHAAAPHLETLKLTKCTVLYSRCWKGHWSSANTVDGGNNGDNGSKGFVFSKRMEVRPWPPSSRSFLRHLELQGINGMSPHEQFSWFIAESPRLKSLSWRLFPRVYELHPTRVVRLPKDFRWTELELIGISYNDNHTTIPDEQLAEILNHTGPGIIDIKGSSDIRGSSLKYLTLIGTCAGELTLQSLIRHHFSSLEILNVSRCSGVTSAMVQRVLSSCPQLKSIHANWIHARDIVDGDPWVCLGLRSWSVFIDLAPSSLGPTPTTATAVSVTHIPDESSDSDMEQRIQQQQQMIFERLGILTSLAALNLNCQYSLPRQPASSKSRIRTLSWRLGAGLERLSGLKQIKEVYLQDRYYMDMSMDDAHWMVDQWPRLSCVRGRLGSRKSDRRSMERFFQEHGIETGVH